MKCFNYNLRIPDSMAAIAGCMLFISLFTSCVKNDDLYSLQEGTVYMPQAYQDRSVMTLYKMDSLQYVTFGAYYAGFDAPSSDLAVQFQIDNSLIAKFNEDNAYLGNVYEALPDSVYTLSGTSSVIKAGKKSSDPLSIIVEGKKIAFGYRYLIPIRITSISAGTLDTSLSVAYFRLDSLLTRMRNLAPSGTLTVSKENNGGPSAGEGSPKLTDNDFATKYLSEYVVGQWAQVKLPEAQKLDAYAITSGNDAPERDPANWVFQGSNDGSNWVTLDTKTGYTFIGRQETVRFDLENPDAYSYYRLRVDANRGSNLIQITEWQLIQFY